MPNRLNEAFVSKQNNQYKMEFSLKHIPFCLFLCLVFFFGGGEYQVDWMKPWVSWATFRDLPISRPLAPRGVSPPHRSEAPRRRRAALRYKTAAMTAMRRWSAWFGGGVGGDNFWVNLQGTRPRPDEKGSLTIGKPGSWGLKVFGGNSNMFLERSPRNLGKMNPCWWADMFQMGWNQQLDVYGDFVMQNLE